MTLEEQIKALEAENLRLKSENKRRKEYNEWLDVQIVEHTEKSTAIGSKIGELELQIATLWEKLNEFYAERDRFFAEFFSSVNLEGCEPEGRS